jgi:hypothetical protein
MDTGTMGKIVAAYRYQTTAKTKTLMAWPSEAARYFKGVSKYQCDVDHRVLCHNIRQLG